MEAPSAAASSPVLLSPGMCVGRYRLLRRLAMGGMAELHLARAEGVAGFQKVVVLKRVLPNLAADEEFTRMFLNEARIAARLDHPNVVHVMDLGESEGEFFYVMEYVHGQNLGTVLKQAAKRGRMPLDVALSFAANVAEGLHYAHEREGPDGGPLGLVHRDVSPANVLVSYDGAVKVTDFGIAKASALSKKTRGTTMKGKVGYMSPEQCRGAAVDRRSDIFSVGILLYELTTTQRLFFADNDFVVLNKVVGGEVDPPSQRVGGDYPAELEAIVMRALALEPADRFPTARSLRTEIDGLARDLGLVLSTARIAEYMEGLFGRPESPASEVVSMAGGTAVLGSPQPAPAEIAKPRRSVWPWIGAGTIAVTALVAGIVIGAGLGGAEGVPQDPTTTEPPSPAKAPGDAAAAALPGTEQASPPRPPDSARPLVEAPSKPVDPEQPPTAAKAEEPEAAARATPRRRKGRHKGGAKAKRRNPNSVFPD